MRLSKGAEALQRRQSYYVAPPSSSTGGVGGHLPAASINTRRSFSFKSDPSLASFAVAAPAAAPSASTKSIGKNNIQHRFSIMKESEVSVTPPYLRAGGNGGNGGNGGGVAKTEEKRAVQTPVAMIVDTTPKQDHVDHHDHLDHLIHHDHHNHLDHSDHRDHHDQQQQQQESSAQTTTPTENSPFSEMSPPSLSQGQDSLASLSRVESDVTPSPIIAVIDDSLKRFLLPSFLFSLFSFLSLVGLTLNITLLITSTQGA